jgi:chlorite dismutase
MSGAPVTLEGWYVLHRIYTVDWPRWSSLSLEDQDVHVLEATTLLESQARPPEGHSACFSLLTHKGDLCLMHWRPDLESLRREEVAFDRTNSPASCSPPTRISP